MVDSLLWALLVRSTLALLLAAGGAASARWSSRPGLTYALCALAIGALLAPPLVEVAVIPPPSAHTATVEAGRLSEFPVTLAAVELPAVRGAMRGAPTGWLVAIWVSGTVALLLLAALRLRRFARALDDRRPASGEVRLATERLAQRLGLRHVPPVYLTTSAITPLLLPRGRRLEILLPSELLERLTDNERDTLLAHELSHVRRRDHWMRWLEFAGATIFWWHPAVWWSRRQLRRAEEQLCDRCVLDHLPQLRAAYARALFKTAEYLADSSRRLPALACGASEARFLKERLMMIVEPRKSRTLSRAQRLLLTLLAIGLLVFLPTWAERGAEIDNERHAGSGDDGQRIIELEQRAQQLELQLVELRAQHRMLEGELLRGRDGAETTAAQESARAEHLLLEAQLRQDAERSDAAARALDLATRELELERHSTLRALVLDAERAAADGDEARARDLQLELEGMQMQVEDELRTRIIESEQARLESQMRLHERSMELVAEEELRLDELQTRARNRSEREHLDRLQALTDDARSTDRGEVDRLRQEIEVLTLRLEQAQREETGER